MRYKFFLSCFDLLWYAIILTISMGDQSRYAASQWETSLQCNDVSHWLSAYLNWSLFIIVGVGHETMLCAADLAMFLLSWAHFLICSHAIIARYRQDIIEMPASCGLINWMFLNLWSMLNSDLLFLTTSSIFFDLRKGIVVEYQVFLLGYF